MLLVWVLRDALARLVARLPSILLLQVTPDVKLDLPQVAVVGSQSSGKSSVLEALVRRAAALAFTLVFCTEAGTVVLSFEVLLSGRVRTDASLLLLG